MATARKRVVVVGGGITGLAAAHRLTELASDAEIVLLEAGPRLGGVIETDKRDGFLIERSADNFITNVPWGVDFCRRIGLGEELISTSRERPRALVVYRGRLVPVPAGFMLMAPARVGPLLSTPLLSLRGKLRLMWEYFAPRRRDTTDESLASFARRRLGREAFERIVQPLVGGIYTADPEKLSLAATMPRFVEMERRHGSLIRAARAGAGAGSAGESGARYGMFVTPRDGLSSMIDAAAARLPEGCVRLNHPVERITRDTEGWKLSLAGGERSAMSADAVIVAVGTPHASAMLAEFDPRLSADLARIEHAGSAIVSLGYARDQIEHPLDGFGFVVPAVEGRRILAGSFSSLKFAGRAPEGKVLVRVFLGGACQSEMAELPDDELVRVATEELAALLGARGEPVLVDIARWPRSMPQYHLGHEQRVADIERQVDAWPTLALAGNAYHGVGIPNCIHSGETAAERIASQLSGAPN
ncbi:MAG: protoporphyrinogen oxidase [Planctomycetota bacterium]|nr:MAG: protoporphyrinogen oxidase [Planctomycetota bacterium]